MSLEICNLKNEVLKSLRKTLTDECIVRNELSNM